MRTILLHCRHCGGGNVLDVPSDAITNDATPAELRSFVAGYSVAQRPRSADLTQRQDAPRRKVLRAVSGFAATVAASVILAELYRLTSVADLTALVQALIGFVIAAVSYHLND